MMVSKSISEKKYEITKESSIIDNCIRLRRIRALKTFSVAGYEVKAGDLGGFVQTQKNLSQDGNCWIFHRAAASGYSRITEDAVMRNSARLSGYAQMKGNASMRNSSMAVGRVILKDNASVGGSAIINEHSVLSGDASVGDSVRINGTSTIYNADLGGSLSINNSTISGKSTRLLGVGVIISAMIQKSLDYIEFSGVGSEGGVLSAYPGRSVTYVISSNDLTLTRGCFEGNLDEFERQVISNHGWNREVQNSDRVYVQYLGLINIIKHHFGLIQPEI